MILQLSVPSQAVEAISEEIAKHNAATGADIQIVPFLEKHLLQLAAQPALALAIPELERQRDEGYAQAVAARTAELIGSYQDVPA